MKDVSSASGWGGAGGSHQDVRLEEAKMDEYSTPPKLYIMSTINFA